MVNHAAALNYHIYTSSLQLCTCVSLNCPEEFPTAGSGQWTDCNGMHVGGILSWEKGFFLFLAAVAPPPNQGSAKSVLNLCCQFSQISCLWNWKPNIPMKHLYRSKVCTSPSCTWFRFTWILHLLRAVSQSGPWRKPLAIKVTRFFPASPSDHYSLPLQFKSLLWAVCVCL